MSGRVFNPASDASGYTRHQRDSLVDPLDVGWSALFGFIAASPSFALVALFVHALAGVAAGFVVWVAVFRVAVSTYADDAIRAGWRLDERP